MRVSARRVPGCAFLAEEVLDCLIIFLFQSSKQGINAGVIVWQPQYLVDCGCVGCYSSATNNDIVFSSRVVGVEFPYSIEVGSSWLSCEAEPTEFLQPFINYRLQAVVDQAIIEKESLFFPSVLCCHHRISCSLLSSSGFVANAFGR
ncbi:hypothetical protein V6N13_052199 [Hibiscus sabdariffa]